jgi:uncharacterized membrane protein YkvA (DUF1232 family)
MKKKNIYFNRAVDQAKDLFGNKDKLMKTIDNAFRKITDIEDEKGTLKGMVDKVKLFLRMIGAYAQGEYREVPWKTMLLILASIIYFLNPFDLIPDFIPGIGFLDDLSVLLWVFNSVENDISKFQENFYSKS